MYRPVQYHKICFIVVFFRAVSFCVLCQLLFTLAKSYDSPKLSMKLLNFFAWINQYTEPFVCVLTYGIKHNMQPLRGILDSNR